LKGSAAGLLVFLAALVLTPLLLWAVWQVLGALQRVLGRDALAVAYQQNLCLLGLVAVSIAVVASVSVLLRRKISAPDMIVGALVWWTVPAILTSLVSPGASYLFIWPLLFSVIGLAVLFRAKRREASSPVPFVAL